MSSNKTKIAVERRSARILKPGRFYSRVILPTQDGVMVNEAERRAYVETQSSILVEGNFKRWREYLLIQGIAEPFNIHGEKESLTEDDVDHIEDLVGITRAKHAAQHGSMEPETAKNISKALYLMAGVFAVIMVLIIWQTGEIPVLGNSIIGGFVLPFGAFGRGVKHFVRRVRRGIAQALFPFAEVLRDVFFIARRDRKAGRFFFLAVVVGIASFLLFGLGGAQMLSPWMPVEMVYALGQPITWALAAFLLYRTWARSRIEVGRLYDIGLFISKEPLRWWWGKADGFVWVEENDGSRDILVNMQKVRLKEKKGEKTGDPLPQPYSRFVLAEYAKEVESRMEPFDPFHWKGTDSAELYEKRDGWEMMRLYSRPAYDGLKLALGTMLMTLVALAGIIFVTISDQAARGG